MDLAYAPFVQLNRIVQFAAIPATIAYNRLVSQVEDVGNKYTAFIEELFVILQRQQ